MAVVAAYICWWLLFIVMFNWPIVVWLRCSIILIQIIDWIVWTIFCGIVPKIYQIDWKIQQQQQKTGHGFGTINKKKDGRQTGTGWQDVCVCVCENHKFWYNYHLYKNNNKTGPMTNKKQIKMIFFQSVCVCVCACVYVWKNFKASMILGIIFMKKSFSQFVGCNYH